LERHRKANGGQTYETAKEGESRKRREAGVFLGGTTEEGAWVDPKKKTDGSKIDREVVGNKEKKDLRFTAGRESKKTLRPHG